MPARALIVAIALLACLRASSPARAAGADGGPPLAPLVVELGVTDSLPADQLAVLRGLLESQLSTHGLFLRSEPDVGDVRRWLARDSGDALLRVALDASASSGWRLLLVDASRGRAVARTLTGGVRRDRAAIEAVVDIVVSAALALHEGLEVASQTVDEALTEGAPMAAPTATAARAAPVVVAASPDGPALRLRAGAGPAVATFARAAPTSWGAAVSVSAWRGAGGLELSAARFVSQTVGGTIGSFAIDRTSLGISAAVATTGPRARLEGGLGLMFEILRRGDATAAGATVATNAPDTLIRVGPQATATLHVSVSRRVALTWALGVGYLPRRVRYLSTAGPDATLAEPWPVTGVSTLRVNVVFP